MKSIALVFLVALVVAFPAASQAQNPIPNPGFETWVGGVPTGWLLITNVPTFATPMTQTANAHTGSSALQGAVVPYLNLYAIPPYMWTKFGVAQRYSTFTGWYTFTPAGGDSMYGWLVMYKSNTPIAFSLFGNRSTRSAYTQFSQNITYNTGDVPDSCQIFFGILGTGANKDTVHVGSVFLLDDLALSGTATGVEQQNFTPAAYSLNQNYPNPFNPSTVISYQLKSAGPVRLTVYDVLGREVRTLVNGEEEEQGAHEVRFDGSGLASGVYMYRLQAGGFVQQRKMLLEK